MTRRRFDWLERREPPVAGAAKPVEAGPGRFDRLELGPPAAGSDGASAPRPSRGEQSLCLDCGHHNPEGQPACQRCSRPLHPTADAAAAVPEVTVVLDERTYHSTDPDLPDDVRALLERIQNEGFRPELLAEWRNWRAVRNRRPRGAAAAPAAEVELFRHGAAWVLAIDRHVFRSTHPHLPAAIAAVFAQVETQGVTPLLLEHLRSVGKELGEQAEGAAGDDRLVDHAAPPATGAPIAAAARSPFNFAGRVLTSIIRLFVSF